MSEEIIKYLKNSIDEKGNYCYSLPVETTKSVIKELNRLNNIINKLEKYLIEQDKYLHSNHVFEDYQLTYYAIVLDKLKALKENK